MAFRARTEPCQLEGAETPAYVLEDGTTGVRAEVWPALGFNCLSWQAPHQGKQVELLWSDPVLRTTQPIRCGIPLLFPFPNRIRGGQFTWPGRPYQLPLNSPHGRNAIHGFACRSPWHDVQTGADEKGAWITGTFEGRELDGGWPASCSLMTTCRLTRDRLRFDFTVQNTDRADLPFGLGLHPYFRIPPNACAVRFAGEHVQRWELIDCLPTGRLSPLEDQHARLLRGDEVLGGNRFDDAYRLGTRDSAAGIVRCTLFDRERQLGIEIAASAEFRDLVLFTPPHREAVCLEPYTCVTDAVNLQQAGVDAGLLVLPPGAVWHGWVEFRVLTSEPQQRS